jgi:hypothetical protein
MKPRKVLRRTSPERPAMPPTRFVIWAWPAHWHDRSRGGSLLLCVKSATRVLRVWKAQQLANGGDHQQSSYQDSDAPVFRTLRDLEKPPAASRKAKEKLHGTHSCPPHLASPPNTKGAGSSGCIWGKLAPQKYRNLLQPCLGVAANEPRQGLFNFDAATHWCAVSHQSPREDRRREIPPGDDRRSGRGARVYPTGSLRE